MQNFFTTFSVNLPYHNSKKEKEEFSKLNKDAFTKAQIQIINNLINNNEWVEEESMSLVEILRNKEII